MLRERAASRQMAVATYNQQLVRTRAKFATNLPHLTKPHGIVGFRSHSL
jgi:hypothetical protein